jgi:type VI secretion system activator RovC-like protein
MPQPLLDLAAGEVRRASDGWHAILRLGAVEHRVWFKEPPAIGANYVAELPFDGDFDARAFAARRLWRAMHGRTPGPTFHELSKQRRERLSAAIRALDARNSGGIYRSIAEVLFGKTRIPDHAWKTHDLRSRTIRLVQSGLALVRGGYRKLLRPENRDE